MNPLGHTELSLTQVGLSLLAGSFSILSPCVLPLLPMVLAGVMHGSRWGAVAMGLGMVVTFAAVGVWLGAMSPAIGLSSADLRIWGALLLILIGILMWVPRWNEMFTQWISPLANSANTLSKHFAGHTFGSAVVLGALLGLVWSPCSGLLLTSALVMAASEGGAWRGGVLLGFFGLGAAVPLILAAHVSRQRLQVLRQRLEKDVNQPRKIMGSVISLTGLVIATGVDRWLQATVLALLPEKWLQTISL